MTCPDVPEEFWNTPIRRVSVLTLQDRQQLVEERLAQHADLWCNEIQKATLDALSGKQSAKARAAFQYVRRGGLCHAERVERFAKIHAWVFCGRHGARPERYHMEAEYIVDRLLGGRSWEGRRTFDGMKKCMDCEQVYKNPFLLATHVCPAVDQQA